MTEKRSQSEFEHISSVLEKMLGRNRLPSAGNLRRIMPIWAETVGAAVAANTRPAALKGNILLVNVGSSSWMQQLRFYQIDILNKLNDRLGRDTIKQIKFKIGPCP